VLNQKVAWAGDLIHYSIGGGWDYIQYLVGGFNPSEKYESQLGLLFPICGKIKHVPNHQPEYT